MSQLEGRLRFAAGAAVVHVVVAAGLLTAMPRPAAPPGGPQSEAWPGVGPGDFLLASTADGQAGADPALVPGARPVDPADWFRPAGRNRGSEGLASALATLALAGNQPLYVSDGWGRTGPGVESDHHVLSTNAWAFDLAVRGVGEPVAQTDLAARRIAAALGHPDWSGGDLRATRGGYRFQLLWRGAGHADHVHIGVRQTEE